jgi:hypothetical protein
MDIASRLNQLAFLLKISPKNKSHFNHPSIWLKIEVSLSYDHVSTSLFISPYKHRGEVAIPCYIQASRSSITTPPQLTLN